MSTSFGVLRDISVDYGICHRLDRATSGPILVAKSFDAWHYLRLLFHANQVDKEYLCLVHGTVPFGPTIVMNDRIRTDSNKISNSTTSHIAVDGRTAESHVRCLAHFQRCKADGVAMRYSLCRVKLLTGRTHQIRVHMSHHGYGLVSDRKYGRSDEDDSEWCSRMFLHCCRLEWTEAFRRRRPSSSSSPFSPLSSLNRFVGVRCPIPPDLAKALKHLELIEEESPLAQL
eukprot:GHVS01029024.1.p1 GENE.GHVS01029024.1~~GHVS01029024.1.p1  ORF type:complete len:229 (+),score=39.24 GHVS01029024.1:177-863(+)